MSIVLCSASSDPHANKVFEILSLKGSVVIWIKPDLHSEAESINFKTTQFPDLYEIRSGGEIVNISSIKSVWFHKPFIVNGPIMLASEKTRVIRTYKDIQIKNYLAGLNSYLKENGAFIVSDKLDVYKASFKLIQLNAAINLGMKVPKTIVTSNTSEAINFLEAMGGEGIIKSLGMLPALNLKPLKSSWETMEITSEHFSSYYNNSNLDYHVLLQEKVDKAYELRITIIGNKIFPCKIDSQANKLTKLDFRAIPPDNLKHEIVSVPKKIEKFCFDLCKHFKLQYGAIDIAVMPDGEYVFFEINPVGQYLWVESMTGAPLSQSMAELLMYPDENRLR